MKFFIRVLLMMVIFDGCKSLNGVEGSGAGGEGFRTVFVGTSAFAPARVFRSSDSGLTWTGVQLPSPGVDVWSIGANRSGVYCTGVFRSTDDGLSWHTTSNIPDNYVQGLGFFGNRVMAGSSNGVYLSDDSGITWTPSRIGIDGDLFIHCFTSIGPVIFAGSAESAGIFKSMDAGETWEWSSNNISDLDIWALTADDRYVYAGGHYGEVFRSGNLGVSWDSLPFPASRGSITSLSVDGGSLYATSEAIGAYRSSDHGMTWTSLNNGGLGSDVSSLAARGQYLFAVTNKGIMRSSNRGSSWSQCRTGLDTTTSYWPVTIH